MRNDRRIGKMVLAALTALLALAVAGLAPGEEPEEAAGAKYEIVTVKDVDFSPSKAAESFVNRAMRGSGTRLQARDSSQGSRLEGATRNLYLILAEKVHEVATAQATSTIFTVSAEELFSQTAFTAEDLGMESLQTEDGFLNWDAEWRVRQIIEEVNLTTVVRAMLMDFPYDMYWYDKTKGVRLRGNYSVFYNSDMDQLQITGSREYGFYVSLDYQGNELFSVDPIYGESTAAAAVNAQAIANEFGSVQDDYSRLLAYKDRICELTDYNDDAWGNGEALLPYGNPWQLIWVFDGNPETKVVCEGYAKAFKHLNDISPRKVSVITAFGQMNGENHMWNIVRMDDGENYLVDVTNCDMEEPGRHSEWLFLVGTEKGSVAEGYRFYDLKYTYSDIYNYTDEQVKLAARNYRDRDVWVYSTAEDGTCVITAYTGDEAIVVVPPILRDHPVTGLMGTDGPVFDSQVWEVILPDELQSIIGPVFQGCSEIRNIIIPAGVRLVGSGAFIGCTNLKDILIASEVPNLEENALTGLTARVYVPHAAGWTEEACDLAGGEISWIRYCNKDGETVQYIPQHTERTEPTCILDGTQEHWTCQNCGADFSDEAGIIGISADDLIIPATGHTYLDPVFRLAESGEGCEAVFTCEKEDDAQTVEALILEEDVVPATCTTEGEAEYTLRAVFLEHEFPGSLTIKLEMLPHTLAVHMEEEPTCTQPGFETYWACEMCGRIYQDEEGSTEIEEPVAVPAKGHDWEEPVYAWADDDLAVTATRICRNGDHPLIESVETFRELITPPGETETGVYRVISYPFGNDCFTVQTKEGLVIPALADMDVLRLPASLGLIGTEGFEGMAAEAVLIPDGCTAIETEAFLNCRNLLYVRIPAGTEVRDGAFEGCPRVVIDRR